MDLVATCREFEARKCHLSVILKVYLKSLLNRFILLVSSNYIATSCTGIVCRVTFAVGSTSISPRTGMYILCVHIYKT